MDKNVDHPVKMHMQRLTLPNLNKNGWQITIRGGHFSVISVIYRQSIIR